MLTAPFDSLVYVRRSLFTAIVPIPKANAKVPDVAPDTSVGRSIFVSIFFSNLKQGKFLGELSFSTMLDVNGHSGFQHLNLAIKFKRF